MLTRTLISVAIAFLVGTTLAVAGAPPSKDGAIAMVKKAVAAIKAEGAAKAYTEISAADSKFVDGEIYIVVQSMTGTVLAHATNPKLVGKDLIGAQDVDGKFFVKDMVEHARKEQTFWYDFKFVNPVTKKIQPKEMYCESISDAVVCAGIYKS